ncbi:single-stranded DNA-binding protein [Cupriavidus taiwanensis]|uniref:single-stranded DNA-binding protein n=1 Tax=Cupriavidus taiwanensis TaxID=164546 RepID=UPI000E165793|nr:single-stranded DNA-binding protein [Cupriavidus taiwanensis]SPA44646.1 Single-stranded DNA-binding protein [Cupriavidus taiwanensis]
MSIQIIGLARIGKDAELRHTNGGEAVANLALAFNYGRKGDDGRLPTQWVDATLWGKRAEALAPYLTKGTQVFVTIGDAHIETYESATRTGSKLVGRVTEIDLAGGGQRQEAPQASRAPQRQQQQPEPDGFEDSQIPF